MTAPVTPGQAAHEAYLTHLQGADPGYGQWVKPFADIDKHDRDAWEAAAQAAIDAATEGTIRACGFTLEDVARFIAAQAPDDGRHPDECPCQFCEEDRREAAAQDDEDDDPLSMAAEDGDYDTCEPTP